MDCGYEGYLGAVAGGSADNGGECGALGGAFTLPAKRGEGFARGREEERMGGGGKATAAGRGRPQTIHTMFLLVHGTVSRGQAGSKSDTYWKLWALQLAFIQLQRREFVHSGEKEMGVRTSNLQL